MELGCVWLIELKGSIIKDSIQEFQLRSLYRVGELTVCNSGTC